MFSFVILQLKNIKNINVRIGICFIFGVVFLKIADNVWINALRQPKLQF
ncbi:hypothetical protein I6I61_05515 [Chryseobacterium sp. FDAARGOS 1104]|nr:hypothetical protein I6I61_05515 [Chryseobacterium sp. FDAARGOS 1104]